MIFGCFQGVEKVGIGNELSQFGKQAVSNEVLRILASIEM